MQNVSVQDPLLTRQEAAAYLGVSTQTLAGWACRTGRDLQFLKVGRSTKYRKSDLDAFLAAKEAV